MDPWCCLCKTLTPLTKLCSRNRVSSKQAMFFQCCSQYVHQGSMCCEFREALLHALDLKVGHLMSLLPSYQLKAVWSFSFGINKAFSARELTLPGYFLFLDHSLWTLRWLCGKIPVEPQFLKYSAQPVWLQQLNDIQLSHLPSPFWCSVWT